MTVMLVLVLVVVLVASGLMVAVVGADFTPLGSSFTTWCRAPLLRQSPPLVTRKSVPPPENIVHHQKPTNFVHHSCNDFHQKYTPPPATI